MKTLFLIIPVGHIAKNILRTDVFKFLKKSGLRIVIFTFEAENKEFIKEFSDHNIVIERLVKHKDSFFEVFFGGVANRIYQNRVDNQTLRIIDRWRVKNQGVAGFLRVRVAGALVGRSRWLMNLMGRIYMNAFSDKDYGDLFEKYSPELFFCTDPYNIDGLQLLRRCIKNNVPVVAMIRSWDNVTNHGILPMRFNKVIVWNEVLRDELVHFHGYSPDQIYISGVPQFDYYHNYKATERNEFFRNIGGGSERKLVSYTTAPPLISPNEQDILEMLCQSIIDNELAYPVKLLIRMHPQDDFSRYEKLNKYRSDNIVFENAGKKSADFYDKWSPTTDDMRHYADILFHSDVIINVASTVSIEAAIFDRPVINIAYDGYKNVDYCESAVRHYDYLHYKNIVKTGGVKLARNHEELIKHINLYLKDPSLDSEGRRRIVEEQCYKLDGRAGERIAKHLLQRIGV